MEVIVYHNSYDPSDSLDQFLDILFYRGMHYFASDLLEQGSSPEDINLAVTRAMQVGKTAGLDLRRHFVPVYTQFQGVLVKDCKLSKLGYALLLLNANVSSLLVANWQMQVLEHYFEEKEPITVFKGHA